MKKEIRKIEQKVNYAGKRGSTYVLRVRKRCEQKPTLCLRLVELTLPSGTVKLAR